MDEQNGMNGKETIYTNKNQHKKKTKSMKEETNWIEK